MGLWPQDGLAGDLRPVELLPNQTIWPMNLHCVHYLATFYNGFASTKRAIVWPGPLLHLLKVASGPCQGLARPGKTKQDRTGKAGSPTRGTAAGELLGPPGSLGTVGTFSLAPLCPSFGTADIPSLSCCCSFILLRQPAHLRNHRSFNPSRLVAKPPVYQSFDSSLFSQSPWSIMSRSFFS